MKSTRLTYGFLFLLILALATLAVLQYRWLGSVSEAEKERLEENLTAASQNFVADFNQLFNQLYATYKVQVTSSGESILPHLEEAYQNSLREAYASVIDTVFYVQGVDSDAPVLYQFASDPSSLQAVPLSPSVKYWLENREHRTAQNVLSLRSKPDLGSPSFLAVPIQFFDMIRLQNSMFSAGIDLRLQVDQLDDLILIRLNDEVVKQEVIPTLARRYFSDSYQDQYELSLVFTGNEELQVYYHSEERTPTADPDFSTELEGFLPNNFLVFSSGSSGSSRSPIQGISSEIDSMRSMSFESYSIKRQSSITNTESSSSGSTKVISRYLENQFRVTSNYTDSTMRSMLGAGPDVGVWQVWLSFKEGSLEAFVNKTRNRNLAISFAILLVLGVSGGMIVLLAQRSKELAGKQMLFVAGVSHELRTPLTVIRSAAENLAQGVIQTEDRKKEYANLVLNEGRRLSDMVDTIMEFSGIQSGKRVFHIKPYALFQFVEHIKEETTPLLGSKSLKLDVSIPQQDEEIHMDEAALSQAVMNVIKNAIKFSPEQSPIQLRVTSTDHEVQFEVEDQGAGIPLEEQKTIFEPFYRGTQAVEDQIKGNGIGLNLAKRVMEAHHGQIEVNSSPGHGARFLLTLPKDSQHG
ncbi:MAG: HAMP domain-containing sensor histidine kinase [Bacteroidota bacterium]